MNISEWHWNVGRPWSIHGAPIEGRRLIGQRQVGLPQQTLRRPIEKRLAEAAMSSSRRRPTRDFSRGRIETAESRQLAHVPDEAGGRAQRVRRRQLQQDLSFPGKTPQSFKWVKNTLQNYTNFQLHKFWLTEA